RVRELAGKAEVASVVEPRAIFGRIEPVDRHARLGGEVLALFGDAAGGLGDGGLLPLFALAGDGIERLGAEERAAGVLTPGPSPSGARGGGAAWRGVLLARLLFEHGLPPG